jgi:hypothetical protein
MSHFILYAIHGEPNSDKALNELEWGPDNVTRDKKIQYCNPFELKRAIPKWLNGVPILADLQNHRVYKGTNCLKTLGELYPVSVRSHMPLPKIEDDDEEPMPLKDEDKSQEVKIPVDPRDFANSEYQNAHSVQLLESSRPADEIREIELSSLTNSPKSSVFPINTERIMSSPSTPALLLAEKNQTEFSSSSPPQTLVLEAPETIST